MLNRYWQWTNGGAESGLPFGPLRFRAWTSASGSGPANTCLPFGPLRFRAWTNGPPDIVVPPIAGTGGWARKPIVISVDEAWRRRLQNEDELLLFIASAAAACDILD